MTQFVTSDLYNAVAEDVFSRIMQNKTDMFATNMFANDTDLYKCAHFIATKLMPIEILRCQKMVHPQGGDAEYIKFIFEHEQRQHRQAIALRAFDAGYSDFSTRVSDKIESPHIADTYFLALKRGAKSL